MDYLPQRVVLETSRHRITGTLTLPRDGFGSRLTDYLNSDEQAFLAVTEVAVEPLDGSAAPTLHDYLAVGLRHVVVARPEQTPPG